MPAKESNRRGPAPSLSESAVRAWSDDPAMQGLDPRRLKPGEVIRLLNSSALGPVIVSSKLDRHRARAGFRIGDGKSVDFFRYVAWLADERRTGGQAGPAGAGGARPGQSGLS